MADPKKINRVYLPWIVGGIALVIYLVTMSHWATLMSLPNVAKVSGWDWRHQYNSPLYFLLTLPARFLPAGWQPLVLNIFAVVCAALTLVLLTRSVILLPQDRTRDQRTREPDEHSLLSTSFAWLAPLAAALMCGLQSTFWEGATAATGEMLDLLVFAYVIRCLLEYRISENDRWISKLAFVYGLGVTNNWAMIGYFPLFLVALIWIKGLKFFDLRFLTRTAAFGAAGLLLYLLLPAVESFSAEPQGSFWVMLKANWHWQKTLTWNNPFIRGYDLRWEFFVVSLTSIFPVFLMGIRWPSFQGDISAAAGSLATIMFRVLHLAIMVFVFWVFFDPPFSGRVVGQGYVLFLSFYYLAALAAGYLIGYVLVVFGREPERAWERTRPMLRPVNKMIIWIVAIAALAAPVGLIKKNFSSIKATNGPQLREFAEALVHGLPDKPCVVLSDDPFRLFLVQAVLSGSGRNYLLLDTQGLSTGNYHRQLRRQFPQYRDLLLESKSDFVASEELLHMLGKASETYSIYYLHPSFGYYFEKFYLRPGGLVYELKPFEKDAIAPPPLSPEEISFNQKFWADRGPRLLAQFPEQDTKNAQARWISGCYSRALDQWGVTLQRNNRFDEAQRSFADAIKLSSDNFAATVNQRFNLQRQKGEEYHGFDAEDTITKRLAQPQALQGALNSYGDFDEPEICRRLGEIFTGGGNVRQGAYYFFRAVELFPRHISARFGLINSYTLLGYADKALELISETRRSASDLALTPEQDLQLTGLEASAYASKQDLQIAEELLLVLYQKRPDDDAVADLLVQFYMQIQRYNDALEITGRQLKRNPDYAAALLNESALHILLKKFDASIVAANRLLQLNPDNVLALLNRAIANFQSGKYDAAKRDYEALEKLQPGQIPAAYYGLGEIGRLTGHSAEAIRNYEKYLKIASPGTADYKTVADRLNELKSRQTH